MKLAVATIEETDEVMSFLQFMDECAGEPWDCLKDDWEDDENYGPIIKQCSNEEGDFDSELFFNYFSTHISHKYPRVVFGYRTLYENCSDQNLDYHDFNPDIKKGLELLESSKN